MSIPGSVPAKAYITANVYVRVGKGGRNSAEMLCVVRDVGV